MQLNLRDSTVPMFVPRKRITILAEIQLFYVSFSCFSICANTYTFPDKPFFLLRVDEISFFLRRDLRAAAFQGTVWLLLERIKMLCLFSNTLCWSGWLRLHSINKVVIATAPFDAYFDSKSVCAFMFFFFFLSRLVRRIGSLHLIKSGDVSFYGTLFFCGLWKVTTVK